MADNKRQDDYSRVVYAAENDIPFDGIDPPVSTGYIPEYVKIVMNKRISPEKKEQYDKEAFARPANRWNLIINLANGGEEPDEKFKLTEAELHDYNTMVQAKRMYERIERDRISGTDLKFCPLIFDNVESEWQ